MTIDVSGILKEFGGRIDIDCAIDFGKAEFLGDVYEFTSPVKVKGVIRNNGESLAFTAECASTFNTRCARCGKDIEAVLQFDLSEDLLQDDSDAEIEDAVTFSDGKVDIDEIVLNSFFMNENGKHLCREDCKGLCPQCGHDLNEGPCACKTENIDPRWAALVDIMNKEN